MVNSRERRRAERYSYPSTVEYYPFGSDNGRQKAVTINVSESGLCAYLFESLGIGDEINFDRKLPRGGAVAAIKWIKRIDEGFFKAGLAYVL
ncbi:MAG: PilZ domain-containing protein [Nitrospirota bacterium]|nr:MAG: PilZ domain-containing protein [Nitrospirota bacterium]